MGLVGVLEESKVVRARSFGLESLVVFFWVCVGWGESGEDG